MPIEDRFPFFCTQQFWPSAKLSHLPTKRIGTYNAHKTITPAMKHHTDASSADSHRPVCPYTD